MDDRQNNGRRNADTWVARITVGLLLLGFIYSVAAWGVPMSGAPHRLDVLESHETPLLYMTCILFQDAHPKQVPKVCGQAIENGLGR